MARIDDLFHYLKDNKGSDLHIAAGVVPRVRANGALTDIPDWPVLSHEDVEALLQRMLRVASPMWPPSLDSLAALPPRDSHSAV